MGEVYDLNAFRQKKRVADNTSAAAPIGRHPASQEGGMKRLVNTTEHDKFFERAFNTVDDWLIQNFCTLPYVNADKQRQARIGDELLTVHENVLGKNKNLTIGDKYNLSLRSQSFFHVLFEVSEDDTEAKVEVMKLSYAKQMSEKVLAEFLEQQESKIIITPPKKIKEFKVWQDRLTERAHQLAHPQDGMYPDIQAANRITDIASRQIPADYYTRIRPVRYIAHQSRELCLRYVTDETRSLRIDEDKKYLRYHMMNSAGRDTVTRIYKQEDDDYVIGGLIESIPFEEAERAQFESEWL